MLGLIALVLLAFTQIALGQDVPAIPPEAWVEKSFFDTLISGEFLAKLAPLVLGSQVILLGLAEGLTRIAVYTDNKWDNKLAGWLAEAAWVSGVVVGKFGYGTPKLVLEEKAHALAEKKEPKTDG